MIAIRKQKRRPWRDYLPAARALHQESTERFWNRLAQMARKENPVARPDPVTRWAFTRSRARWA
jgi:hypothetical protein